MTARLGAVPPWVWVGLAAVAGLGVLAWHRYARDDSDADWTSAKETQPPAHARLPVVPALHGCGSPMSCGPAFRSRSYPGSLVDAEFSVIGEC